MNIDELALKVGATHYSPAPMRAVKGWSFTFEQLQALIAEYEAAGGEPVFVVFDGPPDHNAPRFVEVETAGGISVSVGEWKPYGDYWTLGPLFTRPDPRVSELENALVNACMEVESCLDKSPAITLKNLKDYWFSAGMDEQQSVLETARIAELEAQNAALKLEMQQCDLLCELQFEVYQEEKTGLLVAIEAKNAALNLWKIAGDNAEESELDDMACYCIPMPLFCDACEATEAIDAALAAAKDDSLQALSELSEQLGGYEPKEGGKL